MKNYIEWIVILILLSNFYILGVSRLRALIKTIAAQGIIVALFPLAIHFNHLSFRFYFLALATILLKGIIFPVLLFRAKRKANVFSEIEPYISYTKSIFWGLLSIIFSFWLSSHLLLADKFLDFTITISFFTIFTGFFIIISRKKAITQVIGYLAIENGIYLFGLALVGEIPMLVEIGLLLDAFVAIFVMGIAIYHIKNEFDHIDVDLLNSLKG